MEGIFTVYKLNSKQNLTEILEPVKLLVVCEKVKFGAHETNLLRLLTMLNTSSVSLGRLSDDGTF